jgi:NADH-quinone oxidoreductase subunit E
MRVRKQSHGRDCGGESPLRIGELPVTSTSAHVGRQGQIDLDVVREIVSHLKPQDFQEAQELILSALQEINEHFGWVSLEAAEIVADHLGTTVNRIYGLLTFYADFRTEPRGKHFMLLCHGMACYVMGSQQLVQELSDRYGIADGGTTSDGELTVQVVNGCLGVCDKAPIAKIDDGFYGDLTVESLNDAIQRVIAAPSR